MVDGPSLPARALKSPRVGFGVTTAALVALASTGTGLLVAHGTRQLQPPPAVSLPSPGTPPGAPVLVPRAPGTLTPSVAPPAAPRVVTPSGPPRALPVVVPAVPGVPVALPPVLPPVALPPVALPPPVVDPGPVVDPDTHHGKKAHPTHPAHPDDNGKHLGRAKK